MGEKKMPDQIDFLAEKLSKEDPFILEGLLTPYLEWKQEHEPDGFKALLKRYQNRKPEQKFIETTEGVLIPFKSNSEMSEIKEFGNDCKELRETRLEKFTSNYLPGLGRNHHVVEKDNGSFEINTGNLIHGIVDYYPKANKLLIRNRNKWIKQGLNWIILNLNHKITTL